MGYNDRGNDDPARSGVIDKGHLECYGRRLTRIVGRCEKRIARFEINFLSGQCGGHFLYSNLRFRDIVSRHNSEAIAPTKPVSVRAKPQ